MVIKLLDIETNESELQLTFEKTGTNKEEITVAFSFEWKHSNDFFNENFMSIKETHHSQAEDFLSGISFYVGATMTVDEAQKSMLQKLIIHTPNVDTYKLLELCLNAGIKLNNPPLSVQGLPHPQYLLMSIMHNFIEFPKSKLQELVSVILVAIANSKMRVIETEEEEIAQEEVVDLLNDADAKVVEDELDPAVLALMKQKDDEIKPFKEAMLTFEAGGTEE